jgi:hypothetical protein
VSGEEATERVQRARNGTCYRENQQQYLLHTFLALPVDAASSQQDEP